MCLVHYVSTLFDIKLPFSNTELSSALFYLAFKIIWASFLLELYYLIVWPASCVSTDLLNFFLFIKC